MGFLFGEANAVNQYRIKRVLNNNAAISEANGVDTLLLGPSIGFGRHVGDAIPKDLVEHSYILRDAGVYQKLEELFQQIPSELIQFCMELIAYFQAAMGVPLSDNLFISLPDHIASSLQMYQQGICVSNMMRWEIKSFFNREFELGSFAVSQINKRYGVEMGEDEAAFIALHIINSAYDSPTPVAMEITRFTTRAIEGLERLLGVTLDTDSLAYFRFVTHLKFLGKRVIVGEHVEGRDAASAGLLAMVRERYVRAFQCSERVFRDIERDYSYRATPDDRLYLTIHIQKLLGDVAGSDPDGGEAD